MGLQGLTGSGEGCNICRGGAGSVTGSYLSGSGGVVWRRGLKIAHSELMGGRKRAALELGQVAGLSQPQGCSANVCRGSLDWANLCLI